MSAIKSIDPGRLKWIYLLRGTTVNHHCAIRWWCFWGVPLSNSVILSIVVHALRQLSFRRYRTRAMRKSLPPKPSAKDLYITTTHAGFQC